MRFAIVRAIALAVGLACFGWLAETQLHPLSTLDESLQDMVLARRTPESYLGAAANSATDPRKFITIVAIDERTLAELGAYNGGYPRAYQAQLIDRLLAAPPRVIAFDIGFFEPTPDDAALAAALDRARQLPVPTTVVLSAAALGSPSPLPQSELAYAQDLEPIDTLAQHATVGLANVVPDSRGTVRDMPLLAYVNGVEKPSLGLAAVGAYLRRPTSIDGRTTDTVLLAGRKIPVDSDGSVVINFFGPPSRPYASDSTFRVVSFVDVLKGRVDPSTWRGGLVFVGTLGATGLADDYWTPTSDEGHKMAGVEIHANTAATLFSMNYLHKVQPAPELAMFLVVALLMLATTLSVSPIGALALGPAALALLTLVELAVLYVAGVVLPLALPLLVGVMILFAFGLPRLQREQRRTRERDAVTGLANRAILLDQMRGLLEGEFALLVLNLDRFKDINDSLGHAAGDAALRTLAERITVALAATRAQMARLDGAEFAVLLPEATHRHAVAACVAVREALESPLQLRGQRIAISASIGIAEYPAHGDDPESILRHASAALHAAKETHSGHAVYVPEQENRTADRLELVNALRQAIAEDELRLYYQPKIDCRSGNVLGLEALVRWQHPTQGLIGPDRFIPLAEQTGLIGGLTRWVLETAVRQARDWSHTGLPLKVAVNLSTWDLQDERLAAFICELLAQYEVPPQLLSLEITETAVLADPSRAMKALNDLAARGVDASLDDFGTGYSSLTYVRQLPLRELKIDASFVRGMVDAERDRAIVSSTIELGHRLGMRVVAEGVEDAATLGVLAELECDQAQGYFVSRPMPAESVADWLRKRQHLESRRAGAAA